MGNIRNHNHFPFDLTPVKSDYWDFFLYLHQCGWSGFNGDFSKKCLSAFIDTTIGECLTEDGLQSSSEYSYSKCKSEGLDLENIGFTGTDNGYVLFDKYSITPEEFTELVKNSRYHVDNGDCRLKLKAVVGNNKIFDYSWSFVEEDGHMSARLNGGFFQGIYSVGDGCKYTVLPRKLGNEGWSLDFVLKPMIFANACETLNSRHPENSGIFFYMGTRAENKWIKYYDTDCSFEETGQVKPEKMIGYIEDAEYNCDLDDCSQAEYYPYGYINNGNRDCSAYFSENYMEIEKQNDESADVYETNSGHELDIANVTEIETDNKYAFFDRSCDGVTTLTYEEGDKAVIQYRAINGDVNYFPLFNRSCDGITARDYGEYLDKNGNKYDVYSDLYKNAFALQIKNDGSIGYKYMVCDENADLCSYKIESEFSNPGNVKYGEWNSVHVRINRLSSSNLMRLMVYVNGKLRLVSKELPVFNFKELSDLPDKQEGVPYNISLGGGTQGLCDVIYNEYTKLPEYVYPIEKEFGGTFTGYIRVFRFYECSMNYNGITDNFKYSIND